MSNTKKQKYALVFWNESEEYSVIQTNLIENVECLYNWFRSLEEVKHLQMGGQSTLVACFV